MPKSLGVATMPRPKCQCQTRFAITRAGNGLRGSVSHCASSSRPLDPGEMLGRGRSVVEQAKRAARHGRLLDVLYVSPRR